MQFMKIVERLVEYYDPMLQHVISLLKKSDYRQPIDGDFIAIGYEQFRFRYNYMFGDSVCDIDDLSDINLGESIVKEIEVELLNNGIFVREYEDDEGEWETDDSDAFYELIVFSALPLALLMFRKRLMDLGLPLDGMNWIVFDDAEGIPSQSHLPMGSDVGDTDSTIALQWLESISANEKVALYLKTMYALKFSGFSISRNRIKRKAELEQFLAATPGCCELLNVEDWLDCEHDWDVVRRFFSEI
ncbi:hypothetical protein O5O45_08870 [Hahella aquimaris]|uniref:hypothetical protein n=1 Tax=Hahella sp. HNIBRBA332 TaxID=3015983 RepID=UPI00273B5A1E|nr:hypothetical protein [Hahella sp. HNIBRBA332]WLQ16024.1 hypothetical protein O5O45_08870 [Hahella sp. HNIBRBA332]